VRQWTQVQAVLWEDFWNYDDIPEELPTTPEFEPMFVPWFVLGFVPDAEADDGGAEWPTQPIGLEPSG
jgi:hypothetical protein